MSRNLRSLSDFLSLLDIPAYNLLQKIKYETHYSKTIHMQSFSPLNPYYPVLPFCFFFHLLECNI